MEKTIRYHRKSFYGGLFFISLLLMANFLMQKAEITGTVQGPLVWATMIDVMVILPIVTFTFVLRRRPSVSVFAPLMLLGALFIHWIVPDYAKEDLMVMNYSLVAIETFFIVFEISLLIFFLRELPKWKQNFKEFHKTHPHLLARVHATNQRTFSRQKKYKAFNKLSSLLAADAAAVRFALFPHLDKVPTGKESFSYHKNSEYFGVFLMLVHAMLIEIIAVHVILMQYSHTAAWVATTLDFYALLFLVGDYQAIRKNPLILDESAVHIQKGLRFHMTIPLEEIKGIRPYTSAENLGVKEKEALSLTLGGLEPVSPTFIIDLEEEIGLSFLRFEKESQKSLFDCRRP
ncbi:hypothetical protein [Halobacillus litoralis]|uniref:Beta-carotene 15,15'-monooxygenase n=1 Tax=Halobacillus litoralis TaxID=45668 RepID=A0A410MCQ9_9BACI|nr:hypothetical protein [Halobacillus litoralis]QAS52463.1 hypothetical protein HLI_09650 [Halobacillus litoralis]